MVSRDYDFGYDLGPAIRIPGGPLNTHRVEADVYRRLHETRDEHNDLARRARAYQADLAQADVAISVLAEDVSSLVDSYSDLKGLHRHQMSLAVDNAYLWGAVVGTSVTAITVVICVLLWGM